PCTRSQINLIMLWSILFFLKHHLGGAGAEPGDTEALRLELTELQQKWDLLMEENKDLRNRVRENLIFFLNSRLCFLDPD
uniref:Uncharacterized protein n=1 Tax=Oncorhynchus mykiss TaxID=8022 RepID=A0A8C7WBD8_ONCMY